MSLLSKIFGRAEADGVERETAVVAAQRDERRDRERTLTVLRGHIADTHPDYPDAVERRRRQLGR